MSYSISTLPIRNLHDVFGENDPARRRAAIDEICTEDCVCYEPRGAYRGRDEIDRVAGAIKATRAFDISPLPGPKKRAMAGGSDGYRAALVRRQLTPGLISPFPGTAGLPPLSLFRQATLSWTLPRYGPVVDAHLKTVSVGECCRRSRGFSDPGKALSATEKRVHSDLLRNRGSIRRCKSVLIAL